MKRLTQKRVNGIKTGYWSTAKKDELIEELAKYEDLYEFLSANIGTTSTVTWIPMDIRQPREYETVLISYDGEVYTAERRLGLISSHPDPEVRYSQSYYPEDPEEAGDYFEFYNLGLVRVGCHKVEAWSPLPEPYQKAGGEE